MGWGWAVPMGRGGGHCYGAGNGASQRDVPMGGWKSARGADGASLWGSADSAEPAGSPPHCRPTAAPQHPASHYRPTAAPQHPASHYRPIAPSIPALPHSAQHPRPITAPYHSSPPHSRPTAPRPHSPQQHRRPHSAHRQPHTVPIRVRPPINAAPEVTQPHIQLRRCDALRDGACGVMGLWGWGVMGLWGWGVGGL